MTELSKLQRERLAEATSSWLAVALYTQAEDGSIAELDFPGYSRRLSQFVSEDGVLRNREPVRMPLRGAPKGVRVTHAGLHLHECGHRVAVFKLSEPQTFGGFFGAEYFTFDTLTISEAKFEDIR